MKRTILVDLSDMHAGHRLGLLNPETVLYAEDEEGNPAPMAPESTASQNYLWRNYAAAVQSVIDLAGGDDLLLISNGDEMNGLKYPQQLISTRLADQVIIARDNFKPWYQYRKLKAVRIVAGTAAHSFNEGSSAILLQEQLTAAHPQSDTAVLYHGMLTFNGVTIDYSHHGPGPGNRSWLNGNVARFYLRDLMMREIMAGRVPPDLVLRAHFHRPVFEYLETAGYISRLYVTPPLCMMSEHAVQVTGSPETLTTGFIAWEIVDGAIMQDYRYYNTVDIRTKETL